MKLKDELEKNGLSESVEEDVSKNCKEDPLTSNLRPNNSKKNENEQIQKESVVLKVELKFKSLSM